MASKPITRMRQEMLEAMGREAFAELYWHHRTLEKTLYSIWGNPDYKITDRWPFYHWIDSTEDGREWWAKVKRTRGELDAEESVELIMDATPRDIHLKDRQARALQWRASKVNKDYSDKPEITVNNNTLTVADTWLQGMLEASRQREVKTIEAQVDEGE